jgi:hypothetical protein
MVDTGSHPHSHPHSTPDGTGHGRRILLASLVAVLAVTGVLGLDQLGRRPSLVQGTTTRTATSDRIHPVRSAGHVAGATPASALLGTPAPTTTTTVAPVVAAPSPSPVATPTPTVAPAAVPVATPAPAPVPVSLPYTGPSVATLVAEVEAGGIDPGPAWSWSMGDTSTVCGAIPGNVATGCTFGAAGSATTVFAGSPTLALVAHELANAETENDAVPALMAQVTAAEGGSSWSPIDAAASCLVAHFLGFQDHAAGSWQCPAALATFVAANIHGMVTTAAAAG